MLTDATLIFDLPTPVIDPIESSHTVDSWKLYERADATSFPLSNTKVEQNKLVYSIGKIPNSQMKDHHANKTYFLQGTVNDSAQKTTDFQRIDVTFINPCPQASLVKNKFGFPVIDWVTDKTKSIDVTRLNFLSGGVEYTSGCGNERMNLIDPPAYISAPDDELMIVYSKKDATTADIGTSTIIKYQVQLADYPVNLEDSFTVTIRCNLRSALIEPIQEFTEYDLVSTKPFKIDLPKIEIGPSECFSFTKFKITDTETGEEPKFLNVTSDAVVLADLQSSAKKDIVGSYNFQIEAIASDDSTHGLH